MWLHDRIYVSTDLLCNYNPLANVIAAEGPIEVSERGTLESAASLYSACLAHAQDSVSQNLNLLQSHCVSFLVVTMASHHVLLLGGHGKVAQHLTKLLLQQSWSVTSVIRNPDQVAALEKLGEGNSKKLKVLVRSIEDVKSEAQAKSILDEVKPDYVVWSAGVSRVLP